MSALRQPFDPYAILTALERQRVAYVLIGGFARVIQGTDELTHGLDLTPSLRPERTFADSGSRSPSSTPSVSTAAPSPSTRRRSASSQ